MMKEILQAWVGEQFGLRTNCYLNSAEILPSSCECVSKLYILIYFCEPVLHFIG